MKVDDEEREIHDDDVTSKPRGRERLMNTFKCLSPEGISFSHGEGLYNRGLKITVIVRNNFIRANFIRHGKVKIEVDASGPILAKLPFYAQSAIPMVRYTP